MKTFLCLLIYLIAAEIVYAQVYESSPNPTLTYQDKVKVMKMVVADPLWLKWKAVHIQQDAAVDHWLAFNKQRLTLPAVRPNCGRDIVSTLTKGGVTNAAEIIRLKAKSSALRQELYNKYPQIIYIEIDDWIRFYRECN